MGKILILGLGQCGTSVANYWAKTKNDNYEFATINTSLNDSELADAITDKYVIADGKFGGMAKEREKILEVITADKSNILDFVKGKLSSDLSGVIMVSSTGGGTGSGLVTSLSKMLSGKKKLRAILVSPSWEERCMTSFANTTNTIVELQQYDVAYRVISNGRYNKSKNPFEIHNEINRYIVETETDVFEASLRKSQVENIDDNEMNKLLFTRGYSPIVRTITDDKDVTSKLLDKCDNGLDLPFNGDKAVSRIGYVYYANTEDLKKFNESLVQEKIGTPRMVSRSILPPTSGNPGKVYLIASGCSMPMEVKLYKDKYDELKANVKENTFYDFRIEKEVNDNSSFRLEEKTDKKIEIKEENDDWLMELDFS